MPATGPKTVPAAKPMKFVRGTWPPQPKPMYAQQEGLDVKPKDASTRNYGKQPPLAGNTGMSGLS